MLEREDRQTEVCEDAGFANEGERSHRLLHRDLSHRRKVEVAVVRHHNAVEEDRHDARQMASFSKYVGTVRENQ